MRRTNLILDTDSYKASHYRQYPKGTTKIYSYLESRGGRWDRLVWFGLQYILKILEQGVTRRDGNEANFFFDKHGLPFNYEGWMYIVGDLEGKLPVEIKAVPEGMVVPTHMPLLTIENTDPKVPWLTTYLETMLLRVWYPTTVATESYHIKQLLKEYFEKTADTMTDLPFKLHDFGSRGVSSCESAGIGGMAHLVNFMGSDTVQGVIMAKEVYGEEMAGFSIPAAEHSTITAFGKDHEIEAYKQMIEEFGNPGATFAVVSDSYDIKNAVRNYWSKILKQKVIDCGATVVIRPDSGDPAEAVTDTLFTLSQYYGYTTNLKGYKVLNNVRVIQGDGIDYDVIARILKRIAEHKFSIENIAFGMGGGLLQQCARDTQRFAMKASYVEVDGLGRNIRKNPITDATKASRAGRMDNPLLETVFKDGVITKHYTFEEVRANAEKPFFFNHR